MTPEELQTAIDTLRNETTAGGITPAEVADILEGLKGNSIPLTGTEAGNPVTGNIEFKEGYDVCSLLKKNIDESFEGKINFNENYISIESKNTEHETKTSLEVTTGGVSINTDVFDSVGFNSNIDHSEIQQENKLVYAQRSYVDKANSYSTTETLTGGTWIDGKPIYRKVYEGLTNSNGYFYVDGIADIAVDNVVSLESIVNIDNGEEVLSTNTVKFNGSDFGFFAICRFSIIDNELSSRSYTLTLPNTIVPVAGIDCIIILEYTKTTD